MTANRNTEEKNRIEGGVLYLVATPIGNLADMSERAIKTLSEVDFVAAEDTRNSMRLLTHLGISKPMVSYHEHNRRQRGEEIVERLLGGDSCALVTDAGTPAISDPGEDIVALCAERGVTVTTIPGACAMVCALTLSGLPTARFSFEGFLPVQKKERRERLAELSYERRTFVLHEAPHKLRATLSDLRDTLGGDRRIALCREMTKLNEEVERTTLDGAVELYAQKEPRGEYVLVIEGGDKKRETDGECAMTPEETIAYYLEEGMSRNDALKAASKKLGIPKNELYRLTIEK